MLIISLFLLFVSGLRTTCRSWYSSYLNQEEGKFKHITEEQNVTSNSLLLSITLQLVFFQLHCALVVFLSFLHDISLSPTDYWETGQAFNLLKRPILYLSTLLQPSLCLSLTHTRTHTQFMKYHPLPHSCGSTSAHWLTASFPPLTHYVLQLFSWSQQCGGPSISSPLSPTLVLSPFSLALFSFCLSFFSLRSLLLDYFPGFFLDLFTARNIPCYFFSYSFRCCLSLMYGVFEKDVCVTAEIIHSVVIRCLFWFSSVIQMDFSVTCEYLNKIWVMENLSSATWWPWYFLLDFMNRKDWVSLGFSPFFWWWIKIVLFENKFLWHVGLRCLGLWFE